MSTINVAMIGQGFMGRAHANAWGQVAKFIDPPIQPVMHTVFGQEVENPQVFADRWGWQHGSSNRNHRKLPRRNTGRDNHQK